jgi:multiple sugar transport system substrate-binding protein
MSRHTEQRMVSRRALLSAAAGLAGWGGLVALSACGGGSAASSATTTAATTTATTASQAVTTTSTSAKNASAMTATTTASVGTTASVSAATSAAGSVAGKTTVTYWFWGDPTYLGPEQRVAQAFEQANPSIHIELTLLPYGDLEDKLTATFASGSPPDTHHLDMPLVQSYGKRDVLVDLNPYLGRDPVINTAFYQSSAYSKIALDIMSYQGHAIGLPNSAAPNLYYYNGDMFRAGGLQTPYELWKGTGWTWDAFTNAATHIAKKTGATWAPAGASMGLARLWMNSAGGKEFDDIKAPKQCLYGDPASVEGLSELHDLMYKDHVMPVNFSKEVGSDDTTAFAAGKVAMMPRWTSGILTYNKITSFKWGMVPYPKRTVNAHDFATSGDAIAKVSKVQDAAWAWVKYGVGPEGSAVSAADGTNVYFHPDAQKIAQQALGKIPSLETPNAVVEIMADGPGSFIRLLSVNQDKINGLISPELSKIWNNTVPPADAGKAIDQTVDAFLQANPQ